MQKILANEIYHRPFGQLSEFEKGSVSQEIPKILKQNRYKVGFWGLNVGMALMVILDLFPAGVLQLWDSIVLLLEITWTGFFDSYIDKLTQILRNWWEKATLKWCK